jgi:MYXO-CTERM domain-containing protein
MGPHLLQRVTLLAASALVATPALAAIPAGYLGKPFDPAIAGGPGIVPPTVKAGPYALPGRVSFVNYDMGGDGVGYHTDAHYTTKDGDGYRSDRPSATLSLTGPTKPDLYYDTSPALDGMPYPNATDRDFYVGSVHPGDWFNYTVDVKTAGTYTLSSYFSTGNGPPGGEGGDGQMELDISVNGTKVATWHTVFPDYQNKANFHNWKGYPSFATLTLEAGLQVIKFQAPYKHLNLDYVDFALGGADGGAPADAGGAGAAGTSGGGGASGAAGGGAAGSAASGTAGAAGGASGAGTGAAGDGAGGSSTSGGAGTAGVSGAGGSATGSTGAAGTGTTGAAGTGATGAAGGGPKAKSSGGCAVSGPTGSGAFAALALAALLARARRRRGA